MKTIYLSGGIVGHTHDTASDWRGYLTASLSSHFHILDPMRGKEVLKDRGVITNDTPFDSLGIFRRDIGDIRTSNIVIVNWPTIRPKGVGTSAEAMAAWLWGKEVLSIVDDHYRNHPFVLGMSDVMVESLDQVIAECMLRRI